MPSAMIFFKISFPLPLWMQLLPSTMVACLIGHLYRVLSLRWAPCPWVIDTKKSIIQPLDFFFNIVALQCCIYALQQIESAIDIQACMLGYFSHVFAILSTVALQAPSVHGNSLGKNTGVGCHALHQGIFLTWGLNQCTLQCRQILDPLSHHEAHRYSYMLGSFSGPGPGGPEAMIRKWKRERGWYSLVYAENQ